MTPDTTGVLVTLEPKYLDYAEAEGRALHAKYAGISKFGKRTERGRIASSGARRAVEQLHGIKPGALRRHSLDCVSTPNPNTDYVHVRPEHRGRIFVVAGPVDGHATYVVYGSIAEDRAKERPLDMALHPPAHVWRAAELDPPPQSGHSAGEVVIPDPAQLSLLEPRSGRVHDRRRS